MRIIGGAWRGRPLTAPAGRDTRPTTDRVREAMFSSIFSMIGDLAGIRVLDLYAGSGALGIEALSRGAAHAVFVERDRRAAETIARNLDALAVDRSCFSLERVDASRLVTRGDIAPVSLLFADPPYTIDASSVWQVLEGLGASGLLLGGCLLVYEHRIGAGGTASEGFEIRASKHYGDTGVTYATYEG